MQFVIGRDWWYEIRADNPFVNIWVIVVLSESMEKVHIVIKEQQQKDTSRKMKARSNYRRVRA